MQKKRITVGTAAGEPDVPQDSDGRFVLSVPVIVGGTEKDIALAEKLRTKYLNQRADEIRAACTALPDSRLAQMLQQFDTRNLSELVYGFLASSERHLLTLNNAREIIDEVVRCRDYHFRLDTDENLKT